MSGSIGSIVTDIGSKSLDALWMRANAISDNIANNDTVGYKAKSVDFEDQLTSALSGNTITESQLSGITPKEVESSSTYGTSGNGVDLEDQMVNLTRNQLQYSYLERGVSDNLGLLLTAARGGK
jgi:flagellar basal-body rod protein FlgB